MGAVQPESEVKIAQMFDRIAPRYDLLNLLLSARQDSRWRKMLVREIPVRQNGVLVDVATGTGDVILAAARARREYASMLGVDISQKMLDIARRKSEVEKLANQSSLVKPRLSFFVGSAENLESEKESADCVTISFGLRNVINKQKAISEFYRVLKPKGRLLILEFSALKEGHWFSRLFKFYFEKVLPLVGGLLSDREAYRYLPDSVAGFMKPEELKSLLQEAGFGIVKSRSFLFGSCLLWSADKL